MAAVFVTRALPGDALGRLRDAHAVTVWDGPLPPEPAVLRAAVADAEGLLCLLTERIDGALLDGAPRLRAIANYAVGTDNIDLALVRARGIPVGVTPDVLTELIDGPALRRMRRNAILVNTARGGVVDQAALIDALERGEIAAAAIDVTDPEPPPPGDPIFAAPNLIVAPHIGSATRNARARMTELAVENLLAGLAGRPMPHPAA